MQRAAAETAQDPNVLPQGRHLPSVSIISDVRLTSDDDCTPISLQRRQKISHYNGIDDAVDLIRKSRNILILTGAGISKPISAAEFSSELRTYQGVSCGIPDFRSENGLYASLKEKNEYDLDDPQQMWVAFLVLHSLPHAQLTGSTSNTSGRSQTVSTSIAPVHTP